MDFQLSFSIQSKIEVYSESKFKFIADENYRAEINQNIRISINKDKISLFDKQTELAI